MEHIDKTVIREVNRIHWQYSLIMNIHSGLSLYIATSYIHNFYGLKIIVIISNNLRPTPTHTLLR